MLSDFYLPSPLPPLPFHKECAVAVDDLALPSDDLSHSSLLLQPLFDELPPPRSFRGVNNESGEQHPLPLLDDSYAMELTKALAHHVINEEEDLSITPASSHHHLQPSSNRHLQETSRSTQEPFSALWMHPDCPDCLAAAATHSSGPGAGAASATTAALRSPGDTADYDRSFNNNIITSAEAGHLAASYSHQYPSGVPLSSSNQSLHSWEGSGYYGPVPRTLSSSPMPSPASLDQLPFGCDESFDGSVYSWPQASSSSYSFSNDSQFPQMSFASNSLPQELLPQCADLSPSSAVMAGLAASPLATASLSLSSSPASYPTYPPSASPWLSSSPPMAAPLMPLVPLTSSGALPIEARPAAGDAAQKRKRAQQPPNNPMRPGSPHICTECGADKTPEWRRGPCGPRTLCNACGLRYAKRNKKKKEEELAAANGQPGPTSRKPRSRTASPVPGARRSPAAAATMLPLPAETTQIATAAVVTTSTSMPTVTGGNAPSAP